MAQEFTYEDVSSRLQGLDLDQAQRSATQAFLSEIYGRDKPGNTNTAASDSTSTSSASSSSRLTEEQILENLTFYDPSLNSVGSQLDNVLDTSVESNPNLAEIKYIVHEHEVDQPEMGNLPSHGEVVEEVIKANDPGVNDRQILNVGVDINQKGGIAQSLDRLTNLSIAIQDAGGMAPIVNMSHEISNRYVDFKENEAPFYGTETFTLQGLGYNENTSIDEFVGDPDRLRAALARNGETSILDLGQGLERLADTGAQVYLPAQNNNSVDLTNVLTRDHANIHIVAAEDAYGQYSEQLNADSYQSAEIRGRGTIIHLPEGFEGELTEASSGNAIVLRDAGEHKFNGKNLSQLEASDDAVENLRENYPRFEALSDDFSLSNVIENFKKDPEDSLNQEFLYAKSDQLSKLAGELGISVDDSTDQARFDSLRSILMDDEQYERINSHLADSIEANGNALGLDEVSDSSLQSIEKRLLAPFEGRLVTEEDYESIFGRQLKGPVSDSTDSHRLAVELTSLSPTSLQETYLIVATNDGREIVAQATEGTSWATPDCASSGACRPVGE